MENIAVVLSALTLPNVTVPGPLTFDHAVCRVPFGKPSSLAVPERLAIAPVSSGGYTMPASVACAATAAHGIVSLPAGDFVIILELPTWLGPAFRSSIRFVSPIITRPPQLQAAMSTNTALSAIEEIGRASC